MSIKWPWIKIREKRERTALNEFIKRMERIGSIREITVEDYKKQKKFQTGYKKPNKQIIDYCNKQIKKMEKQAEERAEYIAWKEMEAGKEALRESAARQAREEQAEAAARREANNKNFYQLGDRSYSYVGRDAMANWMSKTNN